jgi:prolyl-tRNA synthetase
VRGDLEVNEIKFSNALGGSVLRAATEAEIQAVGAEPGYASPVGLAVAADLTGDGILVVADPSIEAGGNFVIGANDDGHHYTGANFPRDFAVTVLADIATAETGHRCAECGGSMAAHRAIEIGHCFKLGTHYSEAVNAVYLDEDNQPQFITMGSYGIGLDRLMAVIAELHHDEDGLIWPREVAPYQVHLLSLGKGEDVRIATEALYGALLAAGIDTLYDDRDASAGVKFKDADLIGIPFRLALGGRGLAAGTVELKRRDLAERETIPLDEAPAVLQLLLANG